MRLMKMGSAIESIIKFNPSVLRLSKFLSFMVMSWHWFGCIWWLISDFQANEVLQKCYASATKLMSKAECFAAASEEDVRAMSWGPEAFYLLPEVGVGTKYLRALWWSVSASTGLDVTTPNNPVQMVFSIAVAIIGVSMLTVLIGHASSLLHNIDAAATQRRQKLETIEQYMKYRRVPKGLSTRIVQVTGRHCHHCH